MNKEIQMAEELLRMRRDGFPSPLISVFGKKRVHLLRYAVIVCFSYMLWTNWHDLELRGFLLLGVGIVAGGNLKEMAFLKKIGNNWSFTERVTNWPIVTELAGKKGEVANPEKPQCNGDE